MAAATPKIEVYEAKDGHRWRLRATNGRIIADSSEAYSSRSAVLRAVATTVDTIMDAVIAEVGND